MNIALPALVVFACLWPGFIFRSRLKRVESTSLDYAPFGRVATESIAWATLLHLFWMAVTCGIAGNSVDLGLLLELLSPNLEIHGEAIKAVSRQIGAIALYFGSLYLASFIIPSVTRYLITQFRADRQGNLLSHLFRFTDAPWYYLLTGADFKADEQPDMIVVSAVVSIAGAPILFKGVLNSFYFNSNGSLDRLILEQTMRRSLSAEQEIADPEVAGAHADESRFQPVEGNSFVIRYDQVITLSLHYLKLTPADTSANRLP